LKIFGYILTLLSLLIILLLAPPALAQEGPVCVDQVTVQADDWLSRIAQKQYGDPLAYPAIVEATNAKAETDSSFTAIENPDAIEVGQKLCLVGPEAVEARLARPLAAEPPAQSEAAPETPDPPPAVGLALVADGFVSPIALVSPQDGTGRLFVVDQVGQIRILTADGQLLPEPFLDVRDRMVELSTSYDERGLLGLAFHPNFQENGRFFVYYSAPLRAEAPEGWNHTSHLSEFAVSAQNPNRADPASERIVLQVDQPQSNHNAGQITFGPDGFLYVPLGDGGGANDTGLGHPQIGNGQDRSTLLGSILRLDVDGEQPYAIPPDNPFVEGEGQPEIFAYGFRNPFRIAFDAGGNQQLFAGDAGQNRWEEVDMVASGQNYGWNIREGAHCFDPNNPSQPLEQCADTGPYGQPLVAPILEYQNANVPDGIGLVVIGGFVYRGQAIPNLVGNYLFADWSTSFSQGNGQLFVASPPSTAGGMWPMTELRIATSDNGQVNAFINSFGQDSDRELYVLTSDTPGLTGTTGRVFKLVPAGATQ
jgi:glucose/arabinose dehydrogenase